MLYSCGQSNAYSSELDVSPAFELHGATHDVDALVAADDGLALALDVQIRRGVAGDLNTQEFELFELHQTSYTVKSLIRSIRVLFTTKYRS